MASTTSDREITTNVASVGGGNPGGGDVLVSADEENGLADWALVMIAFAVLKVVIFGTWYGYKTYRSSRQDARMRMLG